jgi:hypothetical protein
MKWFKETIPGKTLLALIGLVALAFFAGVLAATIAVAFKFGWRIVW